MVVTSVTAQPHRRRRTRHRQRPNHAVFVAKFTSNIAFTSRPTLARSPPASHANPFFHPLPMHDTQPKHEPKTAQKAEALQIARTGGLFPEKGRVHADPHRKAQEAQFS